jgi:hypothetical protein
MESQNDVRVIADGGCRGGIFQRTAIDVAGSRLDVVVGVGLSWRVMG